jgi:dipeptidase E
MHGRGYLDHVADELRDFLGNLRDILFVPFALHDRENYAAKVSAALAGFGFRVHSLHAAADPKHAVRDADAIFIGGGNTFRLLRALQDLELMDPIRSKVLSGTAYIGSSAGSNVAGPTIKTTNDMPIVQPHSFSALGLARFQICPHYRDPNPRSTHMGETQQERIFQFLEENETPVAGLEEGAWIRCEGESIVVDGLTGATIFRRDHQPVKVAPKTEISVLVRG